MPNTAKAELVEELRGDIQRSSSILFTNYRGLTVSEITALRRKLREAGAEYRVVKNTLFDLATRELIDADLGEILEGPTAVALVTNDDPVAPAKALVDFMKQHKELALKGGYVDGNLYGVEQIQALSKIPPRDILIAQAVGGIQAPLSGLVGTLQGLMSGLVYTLQAVADQKAA